MTNRDSWHPLLTKDFRGMNWAEWKEYWNKARTKQEMLGLLHSGFAIGDADHAERVCLYLDVADGYQDESHFELPFEEDQRLGRTFNWKVIRREIAQKAFRMLVDRFFNNILKLNQYEDRLQCRSWTFLAASKPVLDKVLWFFRTDWPNNFPRSTSDKHTTEVVYQFLADFVDFIWRFEGFGELKYDEVDAVRVTPEVDKEYLRGVLASRPKVLELMYANNQLWYFLKHPSVIDNLDEVCQQKLKDVALREIRHRGGPYTTLEESWVVGRRLAGMILLLLPIQQKELGRQRALQEAEKLQKRAELLRRSAQP